MNVKSYMVLGCFFLLAVSGKVQAQFGGGSGTAEDPYLIASSAHLGTLAVNVNAGNPYAGKHFLLTQDIDLNGNPWNPWTPIGNKTYSFAGKFHGSNHAIRRLSVSGGYYIGLFGHIGAGAEIDSLHIASGTVTGDSTTEYAGALVGYAAGENIVIRFCSNYATVTSVLSSNPLSGAGGLVGGCKIVATSSVPIQLSIVACTNNGKVTGNMHTGGIVGYGESEGQITGKAVLLLKGNSNSGTVRGTGDNTGGVIGYCYSHENNASALASFSIDSCTNFGVIIGEGENTGGLIGSCYNEIGENGGVCDGKISDSYSHAEIRSTNPSATTYTGGLAGRLNSNHANVMISVENCYATGTVAASSSSSTAGGLTGATTGAGGKIIKHSIAAQDALTGSTVHRILGTDSNNDCSLSANYALTTLTVNGITVSGGITSNNEGADKTLVEIKIRETYVTPYLPWDFTGTWTIRTAQKSYPYLQYQSAPAYITDMAYGEAKLDMDDPARIDSIVVTKGRWRERIKTVEEDFSRKKPVDNYILVSIPCGDSVVAGLKTGDTLNLTVYEKGKAASYPVSGTVKPFYGKGTKDEPYEIWRRSDLERMKGYTGAAFAHLHFRLMNDVDMECDWTPAGDNISPFQGKLHGGGHKLINLRINSNLISVGLFGVLGDGALVDSLHITGGSITGDSSAEYAGAVAGQASGNVVIRACSNNAPVTTVHSNAHTGGLLGSSSGNARIISAHNSGWVTAKGVYTGGLAGYGALTIVNSYNFAWIRNNGSSPASFTGGLAGHLEGLSRIDSSYAAGRVVSAGTVGGLAGEIASQAGIYRSLAAQDTLTGSAVRRIAGSGSGTFSGNYADSRLPASSDATDISLNDIRTQATYTGASPVLPRDFNAVWTIRDGQKSYPFLRYQNAPAYPRYVYRDSVSLDLQTLADSVVIYLCRESGLQRLQAVQPTALTAAYAVNVQTGDTLAFVAWGGRQAPSYPVYETVVKRKLYLTPVNKNGNPDILYGDTLAFDYGNGLSAGHTITGDPVLNADANDLSSSGNPKVGEYDVRWDNIVIKDEGGNEVTGDYEIIYDGSKVAVLQRPLSILADDKIYDGNVSAVCRIDETGIIPGDLVNFSGVPSLTAEFKTPNAGANKTVIVTSDREGLGGADGGNYVIPEEALTDATIFPKHINDLSVVIRVVTQIFNTQTPPIEPLPTVTDTVIDRNAPLMLDRDYEITGYANNSAVGIAQISITGKGNYDGSATADFWIIFSPPEIDHITVNDENDIAPRFDLPWIYVDMGCSDEEEKITVSIHAPAHVSLEIDTTGTGYTGVEPHRRFTLHMKRPQLRTVLIKAVSGDLDTVYVVNVEKRFPFNDLVVTRWNNTMTILPAAAGLEFESYRWFRRTPADADFVMFKDDSRSYTVSNDGAQLSPDDVYYVEATAKTGETVRTCEHIPALHSGVIRIYPNPVRPGAQLSLHAEVDQTLLDKAEICVYTLTGAPVDRVRVTGVVTILQAPNTQGVYLYVFLSKDGEFRKELKVTVE